MKLPGCGHGACPVDAAGRSLPLVGRPGAEVSGVLMGGVEGPAQFAGAVSGVGEVGGGLVDEPAGIDVVVRPDPAGVVLGMQPAAELPEQLRESGGHHREFGDEPVEFGRSGQRRRAMGAVVQLADGFGCGRGDLSGGRGSGVAHRHSFMVGAVVRSVG